MGVLGATDVEEQALDRVRRDCTAGELAHVPRELHADDVLEDGVRALGAVEDDGLPVLAAHGREVVGWITHRDVLRAYHRERERLTPTDEESSA